MDVKDLRPKVFVANPESTEAKRQWVHWYKSFTTYLSKIEGVTNEDKLNLLTNHIDASVYELISEATTYEGAVTILANTYAKTPSTI